MLLIIADGLGFDQISYFEPETIMRLAADKGLQPIDTLLGYSSTIYPCLYTGKYPDQLGFWTEFRLKADAPRKSKSWVAPLPNFRVQRSLRYAFWMVSNRLGRQGVGYHYGVPPVLDPWFEQLYTAYDRWPPLRVPLPGFIGDRVEAAGMKWLFRFLPNATETATEAVVADVLDADLVTLCVPDTDKVGHLLGPISKEFGAFLRKLDHWIGRVVDEVARRAPDTSILLASDHGMTPVSKAFDMQQALPRNGLSLGRDYAVFINATFASFWYESSRSKDLVEEALAAAPGHFITAHERTRWHIDFPDRSYGDAVFLLDPGAMFIPNYISLERHPSRGTHGYAPNVRSTRAFLVGGKDVVVDDVVQVYDVLTSNLQLS